MCAEPLFLFTKINVTEKIDVIFLFCLLDQSDTCRNAITKRCALSSPKNNQKHVTESCSRLHDHSTLLAFDKHANSKNKKPPS